ncbi:hypothetical protein M408DRAFT_327270 [Serendipita vermifera MAFF 305830]|uniref:carbonic anhydrase n=1 Tax=Serendipita vermifera MAFF 305830 TaxID=933852 RepID=A0A0C3BIB2_SERVB|nr:hypothetical protein M408DRAFT_327270 [Serendipita vermifera MAFF 305830]
MFSLRAIIVLSLSLLVTAHPHPHDNAAPLFFRRETTETGGSSNEGSSGTVGAFSASRFPAVQDALAGNERFRQTRNDSAIRALVADGQKPPFMMVSCSDSRAPEATIFDSQPGTFFMERNIANQYKPGDENAQSVMAYGVRVLGVQHVVVMGHYGCGGIAAAIASAPKTNINVATHIVQTWIGDVRALYLSSNRTEIAEMRTRNLEREAAGETVEEPDVQEPGFRALVEENVKQQVKRITESSVISNLNEEVILKLNTDGTRRADAPAEEGAGGEEATLIPVFVHGWVHDIETGEVIDLNISTGPAGFENFTPPAAGEEQPAEEPAASSSVSEGEGATSTSEGAAEPTSSGEAAEPSSSAAEGEGESSSSAEAEPTTAPSAAEPETTSGTENVAPQPVQQASGDVRVHGPGTRPASNTPAARMKRSQSRRLSFAQRRALTAQQAK